jgi:hypothetical protein
MRQFLWQLMQLLQVLVPVPRAKAGATTLFHNKYSSILGNAAQ